RLVSDWSSDVCTSDLAPAPSLLQEHSQAEPVAAAPGSWEWDDAKAIAETWERAGAWDGTPATPAPVPDEPSKPARITLADAVKVFLTSREGAKIAPATLRKYRTFTKQLTDFTDGRGYVMLDQFTSADIDVFYSTWKLGERAKGKRLGTLRAFFRFC